MPHLADSLLDLTVRILPAPVRRRYVAEFEADLRALPGARRIPYAVSTLLGAPRLRWEVTTSLAGGAAPACFLGRHHDHRVHTESPDPAVYALECTRCHRLRDARQYAARSRVNDLRSWYSAGGG